MHRARSLTIAAYRGKLNSHFNSKKIYIAAVVLFEIGSAIAGAAQNMSMLIVGRVLSGLGGSGIYVGTVNIISGMTMASERAQYLNFVGMAWSLGTILGPIVGGAFADSSATWRWAFYINICVAAVTLPACVVLIPSMKSDKPRPLWQRISKIDYLGVVLFFGGVLTIIMVLSFGGSVYGWSSGQMIGLYVAAVVAWTVFSVQQGFKLFTFDRIFPAEFVGDWEMVNLFAWTAIAISNLVITVYTLPLLFQFARGYSALRASVFMLPYIGAGVAAAGAGGPLFAKYPLYIVWFAGAAALMLIGNALMTTVTINTPVGVICAYTVVQGLGFGPVVQLGFTVAQVKKPKDQQRKVTAFLTCAQMGGLALSLGISTCIFLNRTTDQLAVILPNVPRDAVQAAINGARNGIFQTLQPEVLERVSAIIARNAAHLFYLNVAGAAMGFVTALLMPRERLVLERSV